MSELIVEPTDRAAWHRLVVEAEARCSQRLDEDKQSYLVFLLMRYLNRPDLVRTVLALHYLRASGVRGRLREGRMQDVGDQCLLYAGLFPEQAERKRVRLSYFIDLGRAAYDGAASHAAFGTARLFHGLAEAFVPLTDVLHALRGEPAAPLYDALAAAERWAETGSETARRELERYTGATPAIDVSDRRH